MRVRYCPTPMSIMLALVASLATAQQPGFPFILPNGRPDRPMSAAVQRNYVPWPASRPEDNELYSQFKYTRITGLDYHDHDGTVSRRDPSKVVFANGKYYVWYTKRNTPTPPRCADQSTDAIPSTDWDLCGIWYATSDDGFSWDEQGVAVPRPAKPQVGWRSVATPDVLAWKGKYYLYYKSDFDGDPNLVRMQGLAVADDPLGPFAKHPLNPVINSGHETTLFPFKNGITWGISHFTNASTGDKRHSILARFNCDLSLDVHDPIMKRTGLFLSPEVYFSQGLRRYSESGLSKRIALTN